MYGKVANIICYTLKLSNNDIYIYLKDQPG